MKPEIKKRIEMIRRGEVPPGYTKSRIGLVPTEWENVMFSNIFEEKIEFADETSVIPLYSLTIENGVVPKTERYERSHLVKKETDTYKIVSKDQLVYNPMNIRFGALARFKENKKVAVSSYYNIFSVDMDYDLRFIENYLKSVRMNYLYNSISTGSLKEKKRVHFSQFLELELPIPSQTERNKIAEILSEWDKAIEKQEKLIELKKEQKNGLAFKLLTGKARINGFKSKWPKISMSDCFERINEKNHENNNNILTISAQRGLISQEHYFSKQIASESLLRYYLLKKGDYAYNKSYSIGYPFGAIKRLENFEKGIVSPLYICFRIKNNNFSNDYFKQYFDSGFLNEEIQKIAQEGARNHGLLNVSVEEFFQIVLRIPEDIKEQKAIAEILMMADKEIELLEKELNMIKEQKKGLMELLLTGIIRVK